MQELTWKVTLDPAIAQQAMRDLASSANTTSAQIIQTVNGQSAAAIAAANREFAEIQRIHAEKVKLADQEFREIQSIHSQKQSAAQKEADQDFKDIQRIHAEKVRMAEQDAKQIAALEAGLRKAPQENYINDLTKFQNALKNNTTTAQAAADEFLKLFDSQTKTAGSSKLVAAAVEELSNHLNVFVGERLPLVGGGFVKITENLKNLLPAEEAAGAGAEGAGAAIGGMAAPIAIAVLAVAALIAVEYQLVKVSIEATETFTKQADELGRAADQTKLTIDQLDGLKLITDKSSLSFENFTLILGKYLRAVAEAQENPTGPLAQDFERMGIDVQKLGDDPVKAIDALFAAFSRLGPSIKENQGAQNLLSREGIRYITVLRETGGSLEEVVRSTDKLRQFRQSDIELAKKQEAATAELSRAWQTLTTDLGRAYSPEVTQFLKELTTALVDNKGAVEAVFNAASWLITGDTISGVLRHLNELVAAVNSLANGWNFLADKTKAAYDAAVAYSQLSPTPLPGGATPAPTPTPTPTTAPTETATPRQQPTLAISVTNQQLQGLKALSEQMATLTQESIAKTNAALQSGAINQKTATDQIIAALKQERDAKLDYLNAEVAQHEKERELAQGRQDPVSTLNAQKQIDALQQGALEARAKFETEALNARTQLRTREKEALVQHFESLTAIAVEGYQNQIAVAQRAYERGEITQQAANKTTEENQNKTFEAKKNLLEKEVQLEGTVSEKGQELIRRLQELNAQRTTQEQQQSDARKQIALDEARVKAEIEDSHASSLLRIEQIKANALIAMVRNEAEEGIKSHERAANVITGIILGQIDTEIKALENRQKRLKDLYSKQDDRIKAEKELNDRIEQLQAERIAVGQQGNREAAKGRQEDIDNLAKYTEAYKRLLNEQYVEDEEIARLRLELLRATNAPLSQIIKAEFEAETAQENKVHAERLRRLEAERNEALLRVKGVQDEESKKLEIQKAYDTAAEKEKQRHGRAMGIIGTQTGGANPGLELFKKSNPFVEAQKEINQLYGEGTQKAQLYTAAVGALGSAADAMGQAVGRAAEQWILYGKTGESFRQVAAQMIASLAAQALAQAAYYGACALAWEALFLFTGNPDYQAAAIEAGQAALAFGLVGAVGAIAGRGLAGSSFANAAGRSAGGSGAVSGGSSGSNTTNNQSSPVTVGSQRQPTLHISVEHSFKKDGTLQSHITNTVLSDFSSNGPIRGEVVKETVRQQ